MRAQTPPSPSEQLPANFLPRSPTVSAFSRFGENADVNPMTGAPEFNIPLGAATCGALSMPIALAYSYNGLRVQHPLDFVGMGWRLQAGGSISVQVRGNHSDYYYDHATNLAKAYSSDYDVVQTFLRSLVTGSFDHDGEPDVYTVNTPEYSGDFVIVHGVIVLLTPSAVRITIVNQRFVVTLPTGTVYHFDAPEITAPRPANFSRIGTYTSGWQLTRIISASRQDTIQLHYSTASHTEPQRMAMTVLRRPVAGSICGPEETLQRITQYGTPMTLQVLDSICARTQHVVFVRGTGPTAAQRVLRAVAFYAPAPGRRLVRVFALRQSQYAGAPRLRLDEVQESDGRGTAVPPHRFTYAADVPLPSAQSLGQDHWGFYNGQDQNPTLIPIGHIAFRADREPRFAFARGGALEKISYPTGGTKVFTYEANTYECPPYYVSGFTDGASAAATPNSGAPVLTPVPGGAAAPRSVTSQEATFSAAEPAYVRIVTSRAWAAAESDSVRSGAFNRFPEAALFKRNGNTFELHAPPYRVLRNDPEEPDRSNTHRAELLLPAGEYKVVVYCEEQEPVNFVTVQTIYNNEITEKPGPGIRVKQTATLGSGAGDTALVRRFGYAFPDGHSSGRMLLPLNGEGDPQYKEEQYINFFAPSGGAHVERCFFERWSSTVNDLKSSTYKLTHFYQLVTEQALTKGEPNGGTVTRFKDFTNERGDIKQVERAVYSWAANEGYRCKSRETTHHRQQVLGSYSLIEPFSTLETDNAGAEGIVNGRTSQYAFWRADLPVVFSAPDSVVTVAYGGAGNDSMRTTTRLEYKNYLLSRRTTTGSDGIRTVQHSKYLHEYDPTLPDLRFLRHRYFNPVIEQQTWRQPAGPGPRRLLAGTITLYDTTACAPGRILQLENPGAGNSLNAESINSAGFYTALVSDGRYKEHVSYRYGPTGLTAQIRLAHGMPTAYLWGYQTSQPIAAVTNAAVAQVAHTSFEADECNGWVPFGSAAFLRNDGYTGAASFSLAGGGIRRQELPAGSYRLSFWSKEGTGAAAANGRATTATATLYRGWRLYTQTVALPANGTLTLSGTGQIDEVRLAPVGAQMTTYTHDPLVGLTSQTDPSGRTTTYEYDALGRLLRTRDEQGRILSQQQYHYAGH